MQMSALFGAKKLNGRPLTQSASPKRTAFYLVWLFFFQRIKFQVTLQPITTFLNIKKL